MCGPVQPRSRSSRHHRASSHVPAKRTVCNSTATLRPKDARGARLLPYDIAMTRVALVLALAGSAGCVTTAGIVKGDQTSMPLLIGATAGDLVVIGAASG